MKVRRIDKELPLPQKADGAVGFDLICREGKTIPPGEIGLLPVNVVVQVPEDHAPFIFVRSSTPIRYGVVLANGVGVVDPFFSKSDDEIVIELLNFTDSDVFIKRGDVLAQAILIKHERIEWEEVDRMEESGGGYWAV
jgi:dUTP pyrophosphatase